MRIRIVTLNVWNTEGPKERPEIINRELRRLKPDLVALQEVVKAGGTDQLPALLDGLDLHATHQADMQSETPPFADRYGGSAVATRWPHQRLEVLDLRVPQARDVPWATLAVSLDIPGAGEMLFIGATLAWRLNAEAAREEQAQMIADLEARHRKALPTIIAGDFNAGPDTGCIRFLSGRQALNGRSVLFHDAWEIAGEGDGDTWTVENPNAAKGAEQIVGQKNYRRRFDYVFVGSWDAHPKAHARVERAVRAFDAPVNGVWPSDHFGLCVDLDVGTNESPRAD